MHIHTLQNKNRMRLHNLPSVLLLTNVVKNTQMQLLLYNDQQTRHYTADEHGTRATLL